MFVGNTIVEARFTACVECAEVVGGIRTIQFLCKVSEHREHLKKVLVHSIFCSLCKLECMEENVQLWIGLGP